MEEEDSKQSSPLAQPADPAAVPVDDDAVVAAAAIVSPSFRSHALPEQVVPVVEQDGYSEDDASAAVVGGGGNDENNDDYDGDKDEDNDAAGNDSMVTTSASHEPNGFLAITDGAALNDDIQLQADVVDTAMEANEADTEEIYSKPMRSLSPPPPAIDGVPTTMGDEVAPQRMMTDAVDGDSAAETSFSPSSASYIPDENYSAPQSEQQQQDAQVREEQEGQQDSNNTPAPHGPLDAVTLGQLRNLINVQRPKARHYSYPTDADSDSLSMEIDEFYSYVEAPQVCENRAAWEEWCDISLRGDINAGTSSGSAVDEAGNVLNDRNQPENTDDYSGALGLGLGRERPFDTSASKKSTDNATATAPAEAKAEQDKNVYEWTSLPTSARRKRIQSLLTLLEVKDPVARQRASRALLYLLQGSFGDTHGSEHQLSWIMENARMVRAAGGLGEIYSSLKVVSWKHDWLSALPDHIASSEPAKEGEPPPEPLLTWHTKLDYLDEINLELALHFAQLYILVETQRGEEEWGDDVISLDPPLPIFLFGLVAALRDKNAKGYPVKKLLLLLWKTVLACFGGMKDVLRCKELARELEGLPVKAPSRPNAGPQRGVVTKSTPQDLQSFQEEVSSKYPTYAPPKRQHGELPYDKIASAVSPIPQRKTMAPSGGAGGQIEASVFPGTPAPSPPPSPKPNKQKYQTDQSRPFVFPYSRSVQGPRMVPFAIEEASQLYRRNMYVSLEMWQSWRLREECIHEESGVASAADGSRMGFGQWEKEMRRIQNGFRNDGGSITSPSQGSRSPTLTDTSGSLNALGTALPSSTFRSRGEPTLDRLEALERELDAELGRVESDHMLAVVDNARYLGTIASLRQKRADTRRLQRVDLLYRAILPNLQSSIIVLLKLLLATVTQQNSSNSPYFQALAEGIAIEDAPPPTLEDIDIVRHREITSKAISGILLLLLKWFKVSHVMKFNFLSQLLVDSNCLLLILKMFGLTEITNQVKVVNEIPNFNFFRFCELNCGQEPRKPKPEDTVLAKQPFEGLPSPPMGLNHLNSSVEEVEYMDRYSFRNFFAGLNFTRILQKLTKRKVHRILLLTQYKSSAILKRTLKVPHPDLQLYALKVIKSQVPFCGRKWRQSNMKVITAIYLNCRPDLRDEWLCGADVDGDVEGSLPQEHALRGLVKYYNQTRIGQGISVGGANGGSAGGGHRRSISASHLGGAAGMPDGLGTDGQGGSVGGGVSGNANGGVFSASREGFAGAPWSQIASSSPSGGTASRPNVNFFESEILPPLRRGAETTAGTRRYIPDDLLDGYLEDYEDILGEVFGEVGGSGGPEGAAAAPFGASIAADGSDASHSDETWRSLSAEGSQAAWARLGEILGEADSMSDADSIHSLSALGDDDAGAISGELSDDPGRAQADAAAAGVIGSGSPGLTRRKSGSAAAAAEDEEAEDGGAQTWESLSPQAIKYLSSSRPSTPGSPNHHRRRSSGSRNNSFSAASVSGAAEGVDLGSVGFDGGSAVTGGLGLRKGSDSNPLRPVLSFGPDVLKDEDANSGLAVADDEDNDDDAGEEEEMPKPKPGGIDEVEHIWNL